MVRIACLALTLFSIGCQNKKPDSQPHDPSVPAQITDQPMAGDVDVVLAALSAKLPEDWQGTGVLEAREKAPKGAPPWAGVVAEVVEKDGQRFLCTSGLVNNMRNRSLARTAAANRARATLADWLGRPDVRGAQVTNHWHSPAGIGLARAELPVGPDWQPGSTYEPPELQPALGAPNE